MTDQLNKLETKSCGRCGGSGRYSWCQMHGDRCFGCHGKGVVFTKRGRAAAIWLEELRKVPVSTLNIGDLIRIEDIGPYSSRTYFAPIESVEYERPSSARFMRDGVWIDAPPVTRVTTNHPKYGTMIQDMTPDAMVRRAWSAEEKSAQFEQALAYQATLTKAGTPRKIKAKGEAA